MSGCRLNPISLAWSVIILISVIRIVYNSKLTVKELWRYISTVKKIGAPSRALGYSLSTRHNKWASG